MNERKQLSELDKNQTGNNEIQESLVNYYKTPNNNASRSISVSKKLPPHNPNSLKSLSSPKDFCIPAREVNFPSSNYSSAKSTSSPSKRLMRMYKDPSNKENLDPISSHKKKSISPKHQRVLSSSRKNINSTVTPHNKPSNEGTLSKNRTKLGESCESSISKFSETFTAVEDVKSLSRNKQLKLVYGKLAEDYEKDRFYYEKLCKKLKVKRDYLEKKQAELLKEMTDVNDALTHEKEFSNQDLREIMGSKEKRQQVVADLVSKYNDLSDTLQKLQALFQKKKESKNGHTVEAMNVFQKNLIRLLNDKTMLVYKMYEEEEALLGLKERILMINEEVSSRDIQNTELAFEHEELDNLLEEIRNRYGKESEFIINDAKLEEDGEEWTKKILQIKQEKEKHEIEKEEIDKDLDQLRGKIFKQKEALDMLRKTKSTLKNNSLVFEYEKGSHDINKENLDEIGLSAFDEIMKMFEYERISETMTQIFTFLSPMFDKSCGLLFLYQKLSLKEMKILARFNNTGNGKSQSERTNEKEKKHYLLQEVIDKKKKIWFDFINETPEEDKPRANQLLLNVSYFQTLDQSFLNFLNSVKNPENVQKIVEQLFGLMEKKIECFEDQFKCAASLHVYTRDYQSSYAELLNLESKQNLVCSRISSGLKEISNIKEKIKDIDDERRRALEKFCDDLSKTSENLYQCYIGEKEKVLKDVKFKYGKNYVEKVQKDIRSEIFTLNSDQVEKTKEKIKGILKRERQLDARRQRNQHVIEVELTENRKTIQNEIDKRKAVLTILTNELISVTGQEKKLNNDIEAVLGNIIFSEGCFEEEEAFGSLKERLRYLQKKTEYLISQSGRDGIIKESLLTPFTRQKLLEEKLIGIKTEFDKLETSELREIQELEKEVLGKQSSLQEKKGKLDVIQENIKRCCENSFFTTEKKSQEEQGMFSEAASLASEERAKRSGEGLLDFEGDNINRRSFNNLSPGNYTSGKHKPTRSFQDYSGNSMSKYGKITITMAYPETEGALEKKFNSQEVIQPSNSLNQINFSDLKLEYLLYGEDNEAKGDSNLKENKISGKIRNNLLSPTFSSYKENLYPNMNSNQTDANEKAGVESSVSSNSKSSSHNNSIQSMLIPILREEDKLASDEYSFSLPSQRNNQKNGMIRCASTSAKGMHKKGESLSLPQTMKGGLSPEIILERLEKGICVYKRFVVDKGNSLKVSSDYDILDSSITPEKRGYGRRILNIRFKHNKIEFRKEHLGKIQLEAQYPLNSINTFKLSTNAIQTLKYKQMYRGQRDFANVQDHKKFLKYLNCNLFEFYIILENVGKINCICCSEEDINLIKIGLSMINKN